ncbi:hypothetical protein SCORR_v1c10400 (plasmid) [Spiroplasma corruscae]|uniref:Uncharacterized protein n=1 Tax=Spiroplasma corruscae TaxID=216934 RepID=A0A222EQK8_9MOLU|nr:hypothetical protein [Spiroplasma corruscae]ASP28812.1 hypothetical protein SCORR_v1c10400 [Spiroplasma corruscae]
MENNAKIFVIPTSELIVPKNGLKTYTKIVFDENKKVVLDENGKPRKEEVLDPKTKKPLHLVSILLGKDEFNNSMYFNTVYEYVTPMKAGIYGNPDDMMINKSNGEKVLDPVTKLAMYSQFRKNDVANYAKDAEFGAIKIDLTNNTKISLRSDKQINGEYKYGEKVLTPEQLVEKLSSLEKKAKDIVIEKWKEIDAYKQYKQMKEQKLKEKEMSEIVKTK